MLVMTNSRAGLETIIGEMAALHVRWNLRLNKKKSEILTAEKEEEIAGVKCSTVVKYLGVKVTIGNKEQSKIAMEQIKKNVNLLKWRLKRLDSDVL